MFQNPRRVFIVLILLTALLVVIDLPENYHVKFSVAGYDVDRIINPPAFTLRAFGLTIQKSFFTHLGLDLSGGIHVALEANMKDIKPEDRANALESSKQIIERRVNFFGVSEPIVQTAKSNDTYRIIVELPGISDVESAVGIIGQTAKLEFREFTDPVAATGGAYIIPTLENTKSVNITGKELKRALGKNCRLGAEGFLQDRRPPPRRGRERNCS